MNSLKVFILVRRCTEITTKSTTIYKQISSYFDVNIIIKGPRTSFQSSELIKKNVLEMFIIIHITLWPSFHPLKKNIWRSSLYTCVPKITILWYILLEIWSATVIIFCLIGPFFALLPHYWLQNLNLEKTINAWRYYPFTQVHQKWRS